MTKQDEVNHIFKVALSEYLERNYASKVPLGNYKEPIRTAEVLYNPLADMATVYVTLYFNNDPVVCFKEIALTKYSEKSMLGAFIVAIASVDIKVNKVMDIAHKAILETFIID